VLTIAVTVIRISGIVKALAFKATAHRRGKPSI